MTAAARVRLLFFATGIAMTGPRFIESLCRLPFLACVLVAAVVLAPAALADRHALLIGASDYRNGIPPLDGPPNDVALLYQVLMERGFEPDNVRTLVDRVPEGAPHTASGRPTRTGILSQLDSLTARAAADDFVLIYLSGHGSQQPAAQDPTEGDGLDEVFLPSDVGEWSRSDKGFENVLVDDELGRKIAAIRRKGAFVWVVIDSCNSGTMTRAVQDNAIRVKRVDPIRLGLPEELAIRPPDVALEPPRQNRTAASAFLDELAGEPRVGGLVTFFAAQDYELAIETRISRVSEDGAWRSLFSTVLGQAILRGGVQSYEELARHVMAGYDNFGRDAPSPLFEGDLDRPLFGEIGETEPRLIASLAEDGSLRMAAGTLHGLRVGSTVALFPFADDPAGPIVRARIAESGLVESRLVLLEGDIYDLPDRMTAVQESKVIPTTVRVARPYLSDSPSAKRISKALDRLAAETAESGSGKWSFVPPDGEADIYLRLAEGRIWYLFASGAWVRAGRGQSVSEPVAESIGAAAEQLADRLGALAIGRNLLRISRELIAGETAKALEVTAFLLRDQASAEERTKSSPPDARACSPRPPSRPSAAAEAVDPLSPLTLFHCDTLYLDLKNRSKNPMDLTLLFLDSKGDLEAIPLKEPRLHPGSGSKLPPLQIATWDWVAGQPSTVGIERLMIIAVERRTKDDLSFIADFRYLAKSTRTRNFAEGTFGDLQALLESATLQSGQTRSTLNSSDSSVERSTIRVIRWETALP